MKKRIIAYMLMLCQIFQMCGWLTFAEEIQTDTESAEEVIFSYEFESPSEYFMHTGGGLIAHSYSDGAFNLNWDPAAEDRWSYSATTEIPADDVSIITFGVKSNIDCQLKMYYIGENGIGEDYTFNFPVFKSDDYIEYKVATATLNGWTGNINQLRIDMDPLNAGEESFTANIDYIRFLNTSENDYLLENITYKLSAYAGNISVYNTDEISIPAIAQAEALKNGFVCQWQKVGEEASSYISIENGNARLVSYPDTDITSSITLEIKKNSSIITVDYPITIYKKMFEEVEISDASFENTSLTNGDTIPMTGWHRYEGYDWCIPVSISDKYASSGSNSLYINSYAGSLSSDAALSNSFEVTPGKTYTVDFKVYIPESSPVSSGDYIYPYIQCYDASGNFVVRLNGNQFVKGATNGWVNDSFSREIPTDRGIVYGKIAFFAWGGTAYEAYVDDVSVYAKKSGYDEFVSEIKALSDEKISAAKLAVNFEGTDIDLENVGEKIYLSDAVFTSGVNAKITSVSGDGAEYIDSEDYFISLKSRPAHGSGDKTATVTVTLEADGYTENIVYTAIVKETSMQDHFGENILSKIVNRALGTNTSLGAITDNLVFADSYEGYTLTWESSDEDIIDTYGIVTRPSYDNGNETVTITVTAEMNGESFSYSFDVRVLSASYSEMKEITIENNDFETDGGWRVDENRAVNFEFSTKDSFSGNKSLLIPNLSQAANGIVISEKITGVKEGCKYYVEAMVNAENGAKPYVSLRFYNNDGTYLSGGNSNEAYDMNKANEWQSVSASAIAPTGATRVAVAFSGLASGKLAAYFDDVHLYEIPILENGNFEEGLNGWHAEGDVTVAKKNSSDVAKLSGAAKITSSQKPAKKNMHYFARADYKLEDGEGALSLNFYSSTGILIGTESKKLSANSSWSSASVDFMAPGGTTDVCVEISANGTLYADNVKLSSGAYSTGVLDGSFENYYNRDIIKKNETEDETEDETEETEPVTKVKNLVYNESFENVDTFALSTGNNRSDWAISENYDWVIPITVSSDYANSGSKSAHINNYAASLGATGLFSNTFEVTEGTEYTIEYMLYIPEGSPVPTGDYAYPYLELYDADYNYTRRINGSQFIKGATGEWVKCTFKATPGAGEKFGAFVVYAWKDSPYDAYIDDICVYSEVVEEEPPVVEKVKNLVYNESFENVDTFALSTGNNRSDWAISENYDWVIPITVSGDYANSGSKSAHINNYAASLGATGLFSNTFEVTEGTEYTIEYMLYIPEGSPVPNGDYAYPYLELYDADYNYTRRINGSQFIKGATGEWVKCTFKATPGAGEKFGAFVVYAWKDSPYNAYIDDICVYSEVVEEEPPVVEKVKNLVYNESFESSNTFALSTGNNRSDWAISENYDWVIPITVSSDYANSGSKSAHINNYAASLGATGLLSNTFAVTEGTEYTIEYMLYIPEGSPVPNGDYAYPYLELYDADYNYTRRINGSQFIKGATGEWVKCTFKATPGAGEKFGAFVVYAWKDSPYDAYIDDVCVYSEAVIEEQSPPASNNNNLIANNSFEGLNKFEIVTNSQTRTGWGITEGNAWNITITPSNAYANSGSTSVYINNHAASLNSEILLSNTFAVVEGTEYTVEYMLYIPEGAPIPSGDYIYPYLEFYDANYTYTHRVNGSKFATGATDGWVKYSFTATPAAGDVYGAFMIGAWSDSPYEAYIDDIRVLKAGAQEITSSNITDENASDGSYSFKATKDNSFTTNPVNTLVGKDYVFTVRAYAESGTGTFTVEYWGWNGGLNTVGGYTGLELLGTDTVNTTTTGEWETLKLKKTMGFKSQYVKLKGSTKDGEVYFDNFDVFAVSDSVSNAEMENVVSLTMDTAISAELYGTVAYDWKPVGMISVLSTSEEKLSGIMSLRVEDLSAEKSGKVISSMVRNIKPGESYTAELGVKVENGTFNVNLEYFDEDFKLIKAYSEETSSKTWNIITVGGEAPEDAVYAAVSISSSEENEGTCYIDSAKLESSVKDIGSYTQLFIDDYIIKETTMDRTFHEGEKQGIVLEADKPWEGGYYAYVYGSVIYDEEDEIFKMWYTTGDQGQYLAYATSTDGINWEKPILNVYEVNGSTENNILMIAHTPTVIKDNNETDINKRYKMMCFNFDYSGSPQYANSYYGVRYSADGIHWSDFKKTMWGVDVVTAAYDKTNDEYISLFKKGIESKRIQYMTTSKDFENWTEGVRMNSLADPLDDYGVTKADSYGMMLYPYEGVYIGLDWRMRIPDSHNDGHIDGQLVFSRDLKEDWQRPTREALLPCGEEGEFDDGDIYTASYPIEVGDEIWLYYSGADDTHGAWSFNLKTGLAKWRRDGFASMDAKDGEKTLLTEPMIFTGEELHINVNSENGAVYAELLDENMSPINGFTKAECDVISVNSVDNIVSWNGKTDVSALNGETVYLKLYAENSEIYSFGFKAAEEKPGINAIFTQGETITDNKFTDGDLTATVEFGEVVPSATIVIAQYNGTRLVKSVNTSVSNENSISYTLPEVKVSEGNKIKVFVFESTENLSPICDAFELTAN